MESSLSGVRENEEGSGVRHQGNSYLAMHPMYSSPPHVHRRVWRVRLLVALLTFCCGLFEILGCVLPFCTTPFSIQLWLLWARGFMSGQIIPFLLLRKDLVWVIGAAVMTVVCCLVAFVFACFLTCAWTRAEAARTQEELDNALLHDQLVPSKEAARAVPPETNLAVGDDDREPAVACSARCLDSSVSGVQSGISSRPPVPFEEEEMKRRGAARRYAVVIAVCLLCATVCSTVVALRTYVEFKHIVQQEESTARLSAGFAFLCVSAVCGASALTMLLMPSLTHVEVFAGRGEVPRSVLMRVVVEGSEGGEESSFLSTTRADTCADSSSVWPPSQLAHSDALLSSAADARSLNGTTTVNPSDRSAGCPSTLEVNAAVPFSFPSLSGTAAQRTRQKVK